MGASGGAMLPLSSTQRCLKKNSKSSLVKKHTLHWLRLTWSRRHFHSAITAGETGTEHLAKWNVQWNRKFPEFPNFREKRQPREVDQNFRNDFCENLRSIWFCTGISGIFGWMESALDLSNLKNDCELPSIYHFNLTAPGCRAWRHAWHSGFRQQQQQQQQQQQLAIFV